MLTASNVRVTERACDTQGSRQHWIARFGRRGSWTRWDSPYILPYPLAVELLNGTSAATNAGLSAALTRLDRNVFRVVHGRELRAFSLVVEHV